MKWSLDHVTRAASLCGDFYDVSVYLKGFTSLTKTYSSLLSLGRNRGETGVLKVLFRHVISYIKTQKHINTKENITFISQNHFFRAMIKT